MTPRRTLLVFGAVLAAFVLLAGATVGFGLLRGSGDTAALTSTTSTTSTGSTIPSGTTGTTAAVAAPRRGDELTYVRMTAAETDRTTFSLVPPAVGGLEPSTVLDIHVDGFAEFAPARAWQCAGATCGNAIDVQFGADGSASFQYLVRRDFARPGDAGACGLRAAPCSVVVQHVDGDRRAEIQTLFGDDVPVAGRLEVVPATGLAERQRVRVVATAQVPGGEVLVEVCAAPATSGQERCGTNEPVRRATVAADGRAEVDLVVTDGPIGTDGVDCRGGQQCGVVVHSTDAVVRTPPVMLRFTAPPGAEYDGWRVGLGIAVAGLLLLTFAWLVRATDWSAVGEVAAPEIDDAAYADLDAEIAALPPDEDLESASPGR